MKIMLAPDSFKGSLTAKEAALQMQKGVTAIMPDAEVTLKPMADGGEGTLESLTAATKSERVAVKVTGPLGTTIETFYHILPILEKTAVIEIALIAGLTQVPKSQRNPAYTTSYGIGEIMRHAMNRGCQKLIIGIGGSATNDGGLGMLQALGMEAFNENNQPVGIYGKDLFRLKRIATNNLDQRLKKVNIIVASDVDNPLCGSNGASAVFGPQKGATMQQVSQLDTALHHYSTLMENEIGQPLKEHQGAGAAGGLGFALLALGADLTSGTKLIAETSQLEASLPGVDLIITGEGQSDEQTLLGKVPGYVASLGKQHDIPVILLSGSISGGEEMLRQHFAGCFSIMNTPMSLETAMEKSDALLLNQTKQMMHLIKNFHSSSGN